MDKSTKSERHWRFITINILIASAAFGVMIHTPVGYQLLIAG